jgi:hypothetical protein
MPEHRPGLDHNGSPLRAQTTIQTALYASLFWCNCKVRQGPSLNYRVNWRGKRSKRILA